MSPADKRTFLDRLTTLYRPNINSSRRRNQFDYQLPTRPFAVFIQDMFFNDEIMIETAIARVLGVFGKEDS